MMDNDNAPMGELLSEAERVAANYKHRPVADGGPIRDDRLGEIREEACYANVTVDADELLWLLNQRDRLEAENEELSIKWASLSEERIRRENAEKALGVLEGQLATAQERLRELASKQDRIPDTDNGDWGIGWDDGYNAALGEVRYLAAELLPETIAECHHRQKIYLEWHEFPVQSSKRVICSECSGQLVPWDQVDEASLVLWPCKDAVALGLDGVGFDNT